MILKIDLQNCELSDSSYKYIDRQAKRLERYLPGFAKDLPLLYIYLEFHETKGYFDGSLTLHLPKQALNARFKGKLVDEAVKQGFTRVRRELRTYKGKHFVGDSEYPHREGILFEMG